MSHTPDFYIFGGDADTEVLETTRSCWVLETIYNDFGTRILIVNVDPPLPVGPKFHDPTSTVIGLASRSTLFDAGDFGGGSAAEHVVWNVTRNEIGKYVALSSVGIVTIWKEEPNLRFRKPHG